jgi:nicotinamide-nucleotide amidase
MAELTGIPGASHSFVGGAVVYANTEKTRQCGVPDEVIQQHGAVSEAVARALAEGIRGRTGATWGLAVTGVAGPGGGSADKPVGTVHLACAGPNETTHVQVRLPYDRPRNLAATAALALDILRMRLLARWQ